LEILYLQHFSVPEELIADYVEDKISFHTKTMMIGLMRFSGEIFTYIFNTTGQIARTVTKYWIPYGRPLKFSGDDVKGSGELVERPEWRRVEAYDHAIEKLDRGPQGEFCSYLEKKGQVFKNPHILLQRLLAAESMGRTKDVIDGYFLEFLTLYRLGDKLFDLLTEDQMAAHQVLTSEVFNIRRRSHVSVNLNFEMLDEKMNAAENIEGYMQVLNTVNTADVNLEKFSFSDAGISESYTVQGVEIPVYQDVFGSAEL